MEKMDGEGVEMTSQFWLWEMGRHFRRLKED